MNTKLAHIEKVENLEPIIGADKIEKATILGWQVIVRKGEFKINDMCVYIEINSILPNDNPVFAFMTDRKYRVRTIKLRGAISQGLCLPLSYFKEELKDCKLNVGQDVTTELKITRYLSPSERNADYIGTPKKKHNWFIKYMTRFQWFRKLFRKKSKSFPDWISVTDEEKLQNIPWMLKNKKGIYYVTEKLDGQSATYWYKQNKLFGLFDKPEFGICSRMVRKFETDNSNWSKVAKLYNIKEKLKFVYTNICIQGEIVGCGIQSNKYQLNEFKFYVFNVYNIDMKKYHTLSEMQFFCKELGFKMVPILNDNFKLKNTVQEMVELSKGYSILNNDILREGIVVRCIDNHNKSFKVINPEFELKYN